MGGALDVDPDDIARKAAARFTRDWLGGPGRHGSQMEQTLTRALRLQRARLLNGRHERAALMAARGWFGGGVQAESKVVRSLATAIAEQLSFDGPSKDAGDRHG